MKKLSFWLCVAADILSIVMIVMVWMDNAKKGLGFNEFFKSYGDGFGSSLLFKIILGIMGVAYLLLFITLLTKGNIILKVLGALSLVATGVTLFLAGANRDEKMGYVMLGCAVFNLLIFLISSTTRNTMLFWIVSMLWSMLSLFVIILLLTITFAVVVYEFIRWGEPLKVFDQYGRFLGYVYRD